jgi:hypothetical protein
MAAVLQGMAGPPSPSLPFQPLGALFRVGSEYVGKYIEPGMSSQWRPGGSTGAMWTLVLSSGLLRSQIPTSKRSSSGAPRPAKGGAGGREGSCILVAKEKAVKS